MRYKIYVILTVLAFIIVNYANIQPIFNPKDYGLIKAIIYEIIAYSMLVITVAEFICWISRLRK